MCPRNSNGVFKKWLSPIVLLACSTVVALMVGEVAVRWCGHLDENGNFFVRSLRCHPYRLPVNTAEAQIAEYLASKDSAVVWDPQLGNTVPGTKGTRCERASPVPLEPGTFSTSGHPLERAFDNGVHLS